MIQQFRKFTNWELNQSILLKVIPVVLTQFTKCKSGIGLSNRSIHLSHLTELELTDTRFNASPAIKGGSPSSKSDANKLSGGSSPPKFDLTQRDHENPQIKWVPPSLATFLMKFGKDPLDLMKSPLDPTRSHRICYDILIVAPPLSTITSFAKTNHSPSNLICSKMNLVPPLDEIGSSTGWAQTRLISTYRNPYLGTTTKLII